LRFRQLYPQAGARSGTRPAPVPRLQRALSEAVCRSGRRRIYACRIVGRRNVGYRLTGRVLGRRGSMSHAPLVHLVGAGPGAADLLTVRAARLIATADIVLHDALVDAEVLALAPETARLVPVGKRCGRLSSA